MNDGYRDIIAAGAERCFARTWVMARLSMSWRR